MAQSVEGVNTSITITRLNPFNHRRYISAQKGTDLIFSTILDKYQSIPKTTKGVDSLKPNVESPPGKDWYHSICKAVVENFAVPVDLSLASCNGRLVSKNKHFTLFSTHSEPKTLAVPLKYLHLYWDEFASTAVLKQLHLRRFLMEPGQLISSAITSAMADPMINNIFKHRPYITLRYDELSLLPAEWEIGKRRDTTVYVSDYGFGSPIFVQPAIPWNAKWNKNKRILEMGELLLRGAFIEHAERYAKAREEHFGHWKKYKFNISNLRNLKPGDREFNRMWKFYSTLYAWAKYLYPDLKGIEEYWHPSLFYSLCSREQRPTGLEEDEASEVLLEQQATGSFSDIKKAITAIAGAPAQVNDIRESVNKLSDAIDNTQKMVAPIVQRFTEEKKPSMMDFIIGPLLAPLKALVPEIVLEVSEIDLVQLVLNMYSFRHTNNKAAKIAYGAKMLHDAGCYTIIEKSLKYVTQIITGATEEPTFETGGILDKIWEWCDMIVSSPLRFVKHYFIMSIGFLSGFKVTSFAKITEAWKGLLRTCKDLHLLAQGTNALSKLWEFLLKALNHAKIFCNRWFKCSFEVVDSNEVFKNVSNLLKTYALLSNDRILRAVCANRAVRQKFIKIHEALVAVRTHPSYSKDRNLMTMINTTISTLKDQRLKIAIAEIMDAPNIVPFATLFVGKPGIGKSTIIKQIIKDIAPQLGLNENYFNMDASATWMDGYQGHESFVILDDIFSTTKVEDVKFLLNMIGPGVFLCPVAMNELRPTRFESPVVFATANTPYNRVSELTCPDAVDRRFPKWRVLLDGSCYDKPNSKLIPDKFNLLGYKNAYQFARLSTINKANIPEEEPPISYELFVRKLVSEIQAHIVTQARLNKLTRANLEINKDLNKLFTVDLTEEELSNLIATPFDLTSTYDSVLRACGVEDEVEPQEPTPGPSNEQMPTADEEDVTPVDDSGEITIVETLPQRIRHRIDRYFINSQGELEAMAENEITNFKLIHNAPNERVWDMDLRVNFNEPKVLLKIGDSTRGIPERILEQLRFEGGDWILERYVPPSDMPEATNENSRVTQHLVDYELGVFHNWWFSLTPHRRQDFWKVIKLRQDIRKSGITGKLLKTLKDLWGVVWDAVKEVGRMFYVGLLATFGASIFFIFYMAVVHITMSFMESLFENPTSQYTPKVEAKGRVKASDFQAPTASSTMAHIIDAKTKVQGNLFCGRMTTKQGKCTTFNVLGLTQNFYAVPKHVIINRPFVDGHVTLQLSSRVMAQYGGERFVSYAISKEDIYHVPRRDITVIRINDRSMVPSLMRMMPEKPVDADVGLQVVQLTYRNGVFSELETMIYGNVDKVMLNTEFTTIEVRDGLTTTDPHRSGMSGGPSFCVDAKCQYRLVGLMSSTEFNNAHSTVTPLLRGEIQLAIDTLSPNIPEPTVEYATCEVHEAPIIGTTEARVSTPHKTALKKTPLYGMIGTSLSTPVLDGKLSDPLLDGRFKTEKVAMSSLDPAKLSIIVEELSTLYRLVCYNTYRRLPIARNIETAIVGNYIGGKHIELTTSPGIGKGLWMYNREKSGKSDFIRLDEDGEISYLDPNLVDVVKKQIAEHLAGKVTNTTFAQFAKDELRPPGKAPRSIDGSPLEDQIEYRMLFGEFDGMLNNASKVDTRSAPGINLQSTEGHDIAYILTNPSFRPFVYDVKKWDANITLQLWNADADIVNNVYKDSFSTARKMLLRQTCLAPILSGEYIIQPGKGMRSGYPGTANSNTRIHLVLAIYCVKEIMRRRTNKEPTLTEVFNTVFFLCYADDVVGCVIDPFWFDYIDGSKIADEMNRLGFEVVDPDGKTASVSPVASIDKINFLKHKPIWSVELDRFIWRIEKDSLLNCINYTSGPDFTESLDSIFYHAYPYGRKFYEELRALANERMLRLRIQYATTFDMMTRNWKKQDDTGVQPTIQLVPEDFWEEG